MVKHTFTFGDLFYAQLYRYIKLFSVIISMFGIFAIGVMVSSGAPIVIGFLLFLAYLLMSFFVMLCLLVVLAWTQYSFTYRNRTFKYQLKKDLFLIFVGDDEIYRGNFEKLTTKVYRKMTYVYDNQTIVAFFPEKVRLQLLK